MRDRGRLHLLQRGAAPGQGRADAHGRANVPDVIVFLTDGEANIGSVYPQPRPNHPGPDRYPPGNADDQQPCQTAMNLANTYKAAGVTIYSIGYALGSRRHTGDYGLIPRRRNKSQEQIDPGALVRPRQHRSVTLDNKVTYKVENTLCKHRADVGNESGRAAPRSTPTTRSRTSRRPATSTTSRRWRPDRDLQVHRDRYRTGHEQAGGRWLSRNRLARREEGQALVELSL